MSTRPFLPSDLPRHDVLKSWRQYVTAFAIGHLSKSNTHDVAERLYGAGGGDIVARAAVTPTSLGTVGQLTPSVVGPFLESLRPTSAAAQLFARSSRFDMAQNATISLPRFASDFPLPTWVAEGGPVPVVQGVLSTVALGPAKKLAFIVALSNEILNYSAGDAEAIVRIAMDDAAGRGLDAAVFSSAAATAAQPAGLLNGVTVTTATTGGGLAALAGDMRNLIGAISDAGGGGNVMVFANPRQAVSAEILAKYDMVPAPSLAAGTVVAIEASGIASGFQGLPIIDVAREAVVHMDDAAAALSVPGSPPTISAPIRSNFQTDTVALRLTQRCTWQTRATGLVQYVTGATW